MNKYKITYYDITEVAHYLRTGNNLCIKYINAKSDNEAMKILMDKYNIPLNWIKSSSVIKLGL
jgi:hypothetical protein